MEGFVLVKSKRRKSHTRQRTSSAFHNNPSAVVERPVKHSTIDKQLADNQCLLTSSAFYVELSKELSDFHKEVPFKKIICYALGSFSTDPTARLQFALLVQLKSLLDCQVELFDPLFTTSEKSYLKGRGYLVIQENEEGIRSVSERTLFFLPHCPKQLINNILWANWCGTLHLCVLLGNSLGDMMTYLCGPELKELSFVRAASTFVEEIKIPNKFKYEDVFNDFSLQTFACGCRDIISAVDSDCAPVYEDIEFITKDMQGMSTSGTT